MNGDVATHTVQLLHGEDHHAAPRKAAVAHMKILVSREYQVPTSAYKCPHVPTRAYKFALWPATPGYLEEKTQE